MKRVLVVEDDETLLLMLKKQLRVLGVSAEFASNGLEAVDKYKQQFPQLVLMDVHMPGMDGLEATKSIRQMEHGKEAVILALTNTSSKERCLEAGMNGFYRKPILLDTLQVIIEKFAT